MFKLSSLVIFGVLVLSCALNAVPAKAQTQDPPWKKNLNCDYPQKYRGLEYCTGLDGKANVIVIDLNDPDIRLNYLIASGKDRYGNSGPCKDVNMPGEWNKIGPGCYDPANPNYYPVFSLFDAIKMLPDAAFILDSDYGAWTPDNRGHGPEGLAIIDGKRIDGPLNGDIDNNAENRPWLAFGFDPIHVEISRFEKNTDKGQTPDWIYTAFGGAPWLVKDGVMEDKDKINSCEAAKRHSCDPSSAQTAVGIAQERWLYFVMVVDNKNQNVDAYTIAKFMKEQLDVYQAIKLDGGGSSQLYYGGYPETQRVIYRGNGRWLSQYLGILASSGDGIDLESTSPPSEPPSNDDDLSWWQRIQKGWSDFWDGVGNWWQERVDWWNGVKDDIANWWDGVKTWWRELPQRIEDWLLQQFLDWLTRQLNQLCGSAGIIPMAIAVVAYVRRRYHS